ncbi:MAG TPA: hypothetical protein VLI90_11860 [Tepidisphaeraceae bacterium]|nr:hypothetical protein [Tepidisphaeraceae bacterium]
MNARRRTYRRSAALIHDILLRLALGTGLLTPALALAVDDQPTTAPTTQSSSEFAGGRSLSSRDPAMSTTRPGNKPAMVAPVEGATGSNGDMPVDAQVGTGIGPSQGDRVPNAAVATRPTRAAPPPSPPVGQSAK